MAVVTEITVYEYQDLNINHEVVLCDIREPDEHNRERIADAINTPLSSFNSDEFESLANEKVLVFHCQSGNRTRLNAGRFANLKCAQVYILAGGVNSWKAAGNEILKDKKAPLPIMRQVQMIAGILILLGAILGYFVSPGFIVLSAFVGAGLFIAGATGFCGMANLLMLLPYNRRQCRTNCQVR